MSTFAAGGFCWASEATMNIIAPAANLVGSYYKGTIQFGSIPDVDPNNPLTLQGLSLKDLIEISGGIEVMQPQFHLKTGVVNHNIVYESVQQLDNISEL